jgi:tRNA modification GTPase
LQKLVEFFSRSHRAAQQADLILLTIDASTGWTAEDAAIYQQVPDRRNLVINKSRSCPQYGGLRGIPKTINQIRQSHRRCP